MQNACSLSRWKPTDRSVGLLVALVGSMLGLASPGFAATPQKVPTVQTAVVIGAGENGNYKGITNRHFPGSNPPKIVCRTQDEAVKLGQSLAREAGAQAQVLLTTGTKSMEPLIHGRTYVVVQNVPYGTISKGDLLVYMGRPSSKKPDRICMLHRTVLQDKGGWLMSGDNNRWSESWDRVTPTTYIGVVTAIVEFPQA